MNSNFPSETYKKRKWIWIFIFLLGTVVYFSSLWNPVLSPIDASIRADMARNMLETGNLYPPVYNHETLVDHPPLYLWLLALSMKVFGVNDFSAKLPGLFFAFLSTLLSCLIVTKKTRSSFSLLLCALILCTSRDWILISNRGGIEPVFTFFALFSFYLLLIQKPFLSGISIVLSAFSKGPPFLWPYLYHFFAFPKKWKLYLGGSIFAFALWILWVFQSELVDYWILYLKQQVFGSAVDGRNQSQDLQPFYYLKELLKTYWPWNLLLFPALWDSFRNQRKSRVFFLWGLGFFLGFSLVKWKLPYYTTPAYPAFAMGISLWVTEKFPKCKNLKFIHTSVLQAISAFLILWHGFVVFYPLELHKKRFPEIHFLSEWKEKISDEVCYLEPREDANSVVSIGVWKFHKKFTELKSMENLKNHSSCDVLTTQSYWDSSCEQFCDDYRVLAKNGDWILLKATP